MHFEKTFERISQQQNKITKLEALDRIGKERNYLTKILKLWNNAYESGYSPDEIKAFTFRPEFLEPDQVKENKLKDKFGHPPAYSDKNWHNAIRLNNGEVVKMAGFPRPIKPEHLD